VDTSYKCGMFVVFTGGVLFLVACIFILCLSARFRENGCSSGRKTFRIEINGMKKVCSVGRQCLEDHAYWFLLRDAMRSEDYAIEKCLSVCLSVTRWYSVETAKRILKLSPSGSHSILVVPYQTAWQYYDGDTPMVNCDVRPIYRFISEMIQDIHSYYGRRLENRTQAFKWYQLQRPRVLLSDWAKYSMRRSIARYLCDSWASVC